MRIRRHHRQRQLASQRCAQQPFVARERRVEGAIGTVEIVALGERRAEKVRRIGVARIQSHDFRVESRRLVDTPLIPPQSGQRVQCDALRGIQLNRARKGRFRRRIIAELAANRAEIRPRERISRIDSNGTHECFGRPFGSPRGPQRIAVIVPTACVGRIELRRTLECRQRIVRLSRIRVSDAEIIRRASVTG